MKRFNLPPPSQVTVDQFVFLRQKGDESYIFIFDRGSKDECLQRAGKYADDPDLSFDWSDVVALTKAVNKRCK